MLHNQDFTFNLVLIFDVGIILIQINLFQKLNYKIIIHNNLF